MPEYNIPKLDPFDTPYYDTVYGEGDIRARIQIKDAKTYGVAKTKFLSVKPMIKGNDVKIDIDVEIPKVLIEGEYKAEGALGSFKVSGKGETFILIKLLN